MRADVYRRDRKLRELLTKNSTFVLWPVFLFFIIAVPSKAYSQFENDTIILKRTLSFFTGTFFKNENIVDCKLTIIGSTEKGSKINVTLTPVFTKESYKLSEADVAKYGLRFELTPEKMVITPSYCRLNSSEKKISISKTKTLEFEILKTSPINSDLVMNLPFQLTQGKGTESQSMVGMLEMKLKSSYSAPVEEEQPVQMVVQKVENQDETPEQQSGAPVVVKKPGQQQPSQAKAETNKAPAKGSGGGGGAAPGDTVSVAPLEKLREECKNLYNQAYDLSQIKDKKQINQVQVQSLKDNLLSLKNRFDMLFATKYSDVPAAESLDKIFQTYYSTANNLLNGIVAEINKPKDNSVADKQKEDQIEEGQKKNKTLVTILIIMGVVILAMAVWLLVMFLMKKSKSNFQKKMQRKTEMELNRQKFQARQMQNQQVNKHIKL